MGYFVERFWDAGAGLSRPARPGDAPEAVFDAYVPHPMSGWRPSLSYDLVTAANSLVRSCRPQPGGSQPVGTGWLSSMAEALGSCAIEGIRPLPSQVARQHVSSESSDAAEVLACAGTVESAVAAARASQPMSLTRLLELHSIAMPGDPQAGRIRTRQSWIGSVWSNSPLGAVHVPPPDRVPALVKDLCEWLPCPGSPLPVRAAVAHCQFEAVHPFHDGNGRVGRSLIQFVLAPLVRTVDRTLPVSLSLWRRRDEYYRALGDARVVCDRSDWASRSAAMVPFAELLMQAVSEARRVQDFMRLQVAVFVRDGQEALSSSGYRSDNAAYRVLRILPNRPVVSAGEAARVLGLDERTAARAVGALEQAGIVRQFTEGRRNRKFMASGVVAVLDGLL